MECLQWYVDKRLPKPEELAEMQRAIELSVALFQRLGRVPLRIGLKLLLQFSLLLDLYEFGLKLVEDFMRKVMQEAPELIFMSMLFSKFGKEDR